MHALFFEVRPLPGHLKHYFEHVDRLRPVLARHPGLVFLERYSALEDDQVLLSHQLWQDEDAIIGWRRDPEHRRSQTAGRKVHFQDYRIRVGERVLHHSTETDSDAPVQTATDRPHLVVLYADTPAQDPAFASFESVNTPGRFACLASLPNRQAAEALFDRVHTAPVLREAAAYAITRDYGMFERAEAPQQ
ncbi:antibiotic biosynthesis monooxygenase [Rhodobacteraceae bacterium 2376]|uniref:Antibiotic biosynthesis monooxygenase n=1 Tax=Rhabdonatronobacter sediminivivens TaxID=2743469 RepID=A0A7Z0HWU9_9RHOB|nr:antibiotic biosynthesis monooxygenase family protein [Rhabdonatronobacter sediminivivens]NYS23697.1 antibiotic biosynthesis monooxygenase [Rhabdonatronobacter sediminivivens]